MNLTLQKTKIEKKHIISLVMLSFCMNIQGVHMASITYELKDLTIKELQKVMVRIHHSSNSFPYFVPEENNNTFNRMHPG